MAEPMKVFILYHKPSDEIESGLVGVFDSDEAADIRIRLLVDLVDYIVEDQFIVYPVEVETPPTSPIPVNRDV